MNPFHQQAPIPNVKKIISVGSGKGGVGKSTVAANLALALKEQGLSVGLLDADIYGPSIPRLFGAIGLKPEVDHKNKILPVVRRGIRTMSMGYLIDEGTAVVWRGPMLFKAMDQFFRDVAWGDLDVLVIDLPPGTGDVALTVAQKVPVDGAIVVCTPQNMSLTDARKAVDMFQQIKIPVLGMIENMAFLTTPDGQKVQLFPKGDLDAYLDAQKMEKLAALPFDPQLGVASEQGLSILESNPDQVVAVGFKNLAQNLKTKLFSSN